MRVRLRHSPSQIGILTGNTRTRAGQILRQVQFVESSSYVPEDQLEPVPDSPDDPLDLLEAGKVEGVRNLRRVLTDVRLNGRLANVIYSMESTNTDFYAYQFKPILKILSSPTNGILIADEVGLGKTIEAGLIWTELKSRHDLKRLMVLCPAILREKWKSELKLRFGVSASILSAKETHELFSENFSMADQDGFAVITSMQGLRTHNELRSLLENFENEPPLIDLLIIDEAHYLKNPDTQTAKLGRLLKSVSVNVVLLSATPIHLGSRDLFYLLRLLDEDTFNRADVFDEVLKANAPIIHARDAVLKGLLSTEQFQAYLKPAYDHSLLKGNRQLEGLMSRPPTSEQLADRSFRSELAHRLENINLLSHAVTRTRKRDVTEWRVIREPKALMVRPTDVEMRFYEIVTQTVRKFCSQVSYQEGLLLVIPQRQMSSSMQAALGAWKRRAEIYLDEVYEDFGDEFDENEKPGPLVLELMRMVRELGNLDELLAHDSKFNLLHQVLLEGNVNEKVVVFSYFRATLDYLHDRLKAVGIQSIVLKGGGGKGSGLDKNEILRIFSRPDGPSVLLSSEVGSEGIDLQFCRTLVNYDLPWNPMRIEQRIGRLDRLGQQSKKITIWNLFLTDTIDSRIYERLHKRLKIFEEALGGLEEVLGQQIQKLTFELLHSQLTPEQEIKQIEQTAQAISNAKREEEELEKEAAHLIAHGDYILNEVQAARELHRWIGGADLCNYVCEFFGRFHTGCEFKQVNAEMLDFEVRLNNQAKFDLDTYIRTNRLVSTRLTQTVSSPVPCRFENKVAGSDSRRFEIINQFHPLIRFIGSELRLRGENVRPAVSVQLARSHLSEKFASGTYVFTVQQWSITGLQDMERLYFAAAPLNAGLVLSEKEAEKLVLSAALQGEDWIDSQTLCSFESLAQVANEQCLTMSDEKYDEYVKNIDNQNKDRITIQERSIERHFEKQREKLEKLVADYAKRKHPLAAATEGRLQQLKNRFERRKLEIRSRRDVQATKTDICAGVIHVTE